MRVGDTIRNVPEITDLKPRIDVSKKDDRPTKGKIAIWIKYHRNGFEVGGIAFVMTNCFGTVLKGVDLKL